MFQLFSYTNKMDYILNITSVPIIRSTYLFTNFIILILIKVKRIIKTVTMSNLYVGLRMTTPGALSLYPKCSHDPHVPRKGDN